MRSIIVSLGTYAVDFLGIQQQCAVDFPGSQYHVNNDFVLGRLRLWFSQTFTGEGGGPQ